MKTILLVILAMMAVSCSGEKVNDFKIKAAEKAGEAVEKELSKEYTSVSVIGVDCQAEAKEIGVKVKVQVLELLKAKENLSSSKQIDKSFGGEVVPVICSFVVEHALPALLNDAESEYACLRSLGSEKLVEMSRKLCSAIKL